MSTQDGWAPNLSPEDIARIERGLAEMDRRARENDYLPDPEVRGKLDSIAPSMIVTQRPAEEDGDE
jgi:hypothetical protein